MHVEEKKTKNGSKKILKKQNAQEEIQASNGFMELH